MHLAVNIFSWGLVLLNFHGAYDKLLSEMILFRVFSDMINLLVFKIILSKIHSFVVISFLSMLFFHLIQIPCQNEEHILEKNLC